MVQLCEDCEVASAATPQDVFLVFWREVSWAKDVTAPLLKDFFLGVHPGPVYGMEVVWRRAYRCWTFP